MSIISKFEIYKVINFFSGLPKRFADAHNVYEVAAVISSIILTVLTVMYLYKKLYTLIGIFATRKFPTAKCNHKYAVVIAARNEETVIGNLIDSINRQDYDMSLVDIFVVADNCTDKTAEIARQKGAVCYERFDNEHCTKGYALQFLFQNIERDYKTDSYEGFFVFDADNLLKRDYITRMNEAFDSGEKIITSYRNTKNFDENWVASTYAIHWLRSIRVNHRARSVLKLATNIQGTGFLFTSEIVKNGWKYVSLTEDRALTADAVVAGYRISYCDAAEFYDEQPVSVKIAVRHRVRWAKGHIQAFFESGWGLFKNIFRGKGFRQKFMSYDVLLMIFPRAIFSLFRLLILLALQIICYVGTKSLWSIVVVSFLYSSRLRYYLRSYLRNFFYGIYVLVFEQKRIKKMPIYKQFFYCLTWPLFDFLGIWAMYIALFTKVTWKPIPHKSQVNIDDINRTVNGNENDIIEKTKEAEEAVK